MKVLVLGAGVVGTTTAYFLAKDGHEVEVVDRQEKAAMETSFSNAGMIAPGHAYTWASPRAPKILWQSLFRDDTALKFRLRLDPALWTWSWKFLRECSAPRAATNTVNKVRLCLYSQRLFGEINRAEAISYDRQVGGALYLYRDREHFNRAVAATRVLTDNGVTLLPIDPEKIAFDRSMWIVARVGIWPDRFPGVQFPPGEREQYPPSPQRLVRVHQGSKRKTLYLSAHASHVVDWPAADGRLLLWDLTAHATQPRFVYSHTWRVGDVVIWDNRCTMHRGRPHDEQQARDLRRATTLDTASTLDQAA